MSQDRASENNSFIPVPLLDVSRDNQPLRDELIDAMVRVFDSGQYIGGPDCQSFEQSIAQVCDTKYAVGCASGSDALLLALMALDIGPGDEVILPSFTFFATASCVSRLGATPVFVDVDIESYNIAPELVEKAITSRTKAIIPVHLFGQCADMDELMRIAQENDLYVVEDCAQSIGASYKGRKAGSIGHVGCFSFYPTKNLGGFGDAGIITTNDADLSDRLRLLANHGMRPRYHHQEIGVNSRLDSIQAALLNIKIKYLEDWSTKRAENARLYQTLMQRAGLNGCIVCPSAAANSEHVWNQFTIRIPGGQRDAVRQKLAESKIGSEIYYPIPLHRQVCFSHLGFDKGSLPTTEKLSNEVLSLPIFPELRREEIESVVGRLAEIMQVTGERRAVA
ncbi:MAG: DegT/DnrJ/EryC1/StrS family aminotransferase [Pirellulaceae bacterium]